MQVSELSQMLREVQRGLQKRRMRVIDDAHRFELYPHTVPNRPAVLRAMLYHRIEDPAAVHAELAPDLVTASPAQFDRQLRHLARAYHPIDAAELLAAVSGRHKLPPRAVVITFDDGY